MQPDEARALFDRSYSAWSRGDAEALVAVYHPECVWDNSRVPIDPKVHQGHDGLRRAVVEWFDSWDEFHVEIAEMSQLSAAAFLLVGRGRGRGKGSGVPVDLPPLHQIVTVRDELILSVVNYLDADEAAAEARKLEGAT